MESLTIEHFFSIQFLLTLYTVLVAIFTLAIILTNNCAKQVQQNNPYLVGRIFDLERLLYTELIIVLTLFTLYVFSPLICIIFDRLKLVDIKLSLGWFYGGSYLMVSMLMLFMLTGFYQVNKIHRDLKHDIKVSSFIPTTKKRTK